MGINLIKFFICFLCFSNNIAMKANINMSINLAIFSMITVIMIMITVIMLKMAKFMDILIFAFMAILLLKHKKQMKNLMRFIPIHTLN